MDELDKYQQKILDAKIALYTLLIKKCSFDRTDNDDDILYFLAKDMNLVKYFDNIEIE